MTAPKFYVVARVVSRDGALPIWKERVASLVTVSASERLGDSYYWGHSLDGDTDTIIGLEGYTHAVGLFIGHFETDVFKQQVKLIDGAELLRHQQGLDSPDYDLHHYDLIGGWLKRADDVDKDSKTSHVAVYHFWATEEGKRPELLRELVAFADGLKGDTRSHWHCAERCRSERDQTCYYGNTLDTFSPEVDTEFAVRTKNTDAFNAFRSSGPLPNLLQDLQPLTEKTELLQAQAFNGHLELKP